MKKITLGLALMLGASSIATAQEVGINTATPKTTLQVVGTNDKGAVDGKDGLLVPRVNDLAADGTEDGQLVYLTTAAGTFTPGFHFWKVDAVSAANSAWTPLKAGADALDFVRPVGNRNILSATAGVGTDGTNAGGNDNVFIGDKAGSKNALGGSTYIGTNAGLNATGADNIAIGVDALRGAVTEAAGGGNVALGLRTLENLENGADNFIVGTQSGFGLKVGGNNILLGQTSGSNLINGDRNVAIGDVNFVHADNKGATGVLANGQLNIQNILFGIGNNGENSTLSTGNIGIGVKEPVEKLEVNGTAKADNLRLAVKRVSVGASINAATDFLIISDNDVGDATPAQRSIVTLPAVADVANGKFFVVHNENPGILYVRPNGTETLNNSNVEAGWVTIPKYTSVTFYMFDNEWHANTPNDNRVGVRTVTENTIIRPFTDHLILSNNNVSGGARSEITLPDATLAGSGASFVVKNIHPTDPAYVVTSPNTQTIETAAEDSLLPWQTVTYISDGSNWWVLSEK